MSTNGICEGCGAALLLSRGRPRKWCSDRCRKRTLYSGACVDCGAQTVGTASGGAGSWDWSATQAFLVIFSLMLLAGMGGFVVGVVHG